MNLQNTLSVFLAACAILLLALVSGAGGQGLTNRQRQNVFRQQVSSPRRRSGRRRNSFRGRNRQRTRCNARRRRRGQCSSSINPPRVATQAPTRTPRPPTPGGNDLTIVINRATSWILENHARIPNMVQLVFHSCVGETACDGCINTEVGDNKGLIGTYGEVQALWAESFTDRISLADMIVLLGTKAVEIGMAKQGGPGRRTVTFRPGRRTCEDPGKYTLNHEFPKGGNIDGVESLMKEFDLPSRESAIALLGAHSLGQSRRENSGFDGRWDNTPLILDNGYYRSMTGTNWRVTDAPGNSQTQWSADDGRMMLNADLHLHKRFSINGNDRPTCQTSNRCRNSGDAGTIAMFARDQSRWATAFIAAFEKMVNKGR